MTTNKKSIIPVYNKDWVYLSTIESVLEKQEYLKFRYNKSTEKYINYMISAVKSSDLTDYFSENGMSYTIKQVVNSYVEFKSIKGNVCMDDVRRILTRVLYNEFEQFIVGSASPGKNEVYFEDFSLFLNRYKIPYKIINVNI